MEIIAGMIDTTDWVDLYALASPWTGFSNFVFATGGASIPVPDDAALGAYVNAMLNDNLYIIGGFADSNADSTDPFEGFDTFGDHEFFKTIELGWVTSRDRFYLDNTHVTYWQADERVQAGVLDGWGINFSFEHSFEDKWLPFVRAGYADDGGSLLQKTFGAGFGYHFGDKNSLLGLGVHWGEPNEGTFGPGLKDQYTVELFSRLQVMKNLQITPDIQYIKDPARNTEEDSSWIIGLRARLIF
jgi:porin